MSAGQRRQGPLSQAIFGMDTKALKLQGIPGVTPTTNLSFCNTEGDKRGMLGRVLAKHLV